MASTAIMNRLKALKAQGFSLDGKNTPATQVARDAPANNSQSSARSSPPATQGRTPQAAAMIQQLQQNAAQGNYLDTPQNAAQAAARVPLNQNGTPSNILPGDVSFGSGSQSLQGSAYEMYPTGSYNTQFARYRDPLQTGNESVDAASNQTIGQYAQYERALEPNISQLIDTNKSNQKRYEQQAQQDYNKYVEGNAGMQQQSNDYYTGLGNYLNSEQGAQQAFAANEARRATGSQQSAQAAGQRVGAQYVGMSNEARAQKYAEDRALFNELTNKTAEYTANIKGSKDQYELDLAKQLLDLRNQLASSLVQQQQGLIQPNMQFGLNDLAAQRALVRQQTLDQSQAELNAQYAKSSGGGGTSTTAVAPTPIPGVSTPQPATTTGAQPVANLANGNVKWSDGTTRTRAGVIVI